jgi:hypothetical protein
LSGSLYLSPVDCRAPAPQTAVIVQALRDLALIGEPLSEGTFAVGPNFNRHVVFSGCSPHLVFAAPRPGDLDFCHFAILGPYAEAHLITGPHSRRPRCPICAKRAQSWQELQAAWQAVGQTAKHRCSGCGHDTAVLAWRWQRQAVFGRLFLAVRGVFPSEAVPSEALIDALGGATGRAWDYGWAPTVEP